MSVNNGGARGGYSGPFEDIAACWTTKIKWANRERQISSKYTCEKDRLIDL